MYGGMLSFSLGMRTLAKVHAHSYDGRASPTEIGRPQCDQGSDIAKYSKRVLDVSSQSFIDFILMHFSFTFPGLHAISQFLIKQASISFGLWNHSKADQSVKVDVIRAIAHGMT